MCEEDDDADDDNEGVARAVLPDPFKTLMNMRLRFCSCLSCGPRRAPESALHLNFENCTKRCLTLIGSNKVVGNKLEVFNCINKCKIVRFVREQIGGTVS